ncbi:MAG: hypothetical protein ACPL5F_08930 [Moorellaceae bacterium]
MKKVRFISLALVLALALMGAAFAAWTETINVNGSVATGNYDVTFSSSSTNDEGTTVDPGLDKNVGQSVATLGADSKSITVTASNAYPGYNAIVTYKIKNTGTIPLKVNNAVITNTNAQITVTNEVDPAGQIIDPGQEFEAQVKHVVNDSAAETSTYTYSVAVNTVQWNQ